MGANGLGVARSLGRNGIPVVGVDFHPKDPGMRSRFVKSMDVDDPVTRPEVVLDSLLREGRKLSERGVLFVTSDAFLLFVSRNRQELSEVFDFTIPSERIVEGMVNKRLQYEEASRLGIPIPETHYPTSIREVREIKDIVKYPAFIKPYYSHLWNLRFGNKGFIVRDGKELIEKFELIFTTDLEALVQQIIMPPGQNFACGAIYFGRGGYVSPAFTWLKRRARPPNFGVGSFLESKKDPSVADLTLQFMTGLDYHGTGMVAFKKDVTDNQWKLIELNSRIWLQNNLPAHAGIDFPLLEYLDIIGKLDGYRPEFEEGVRWWDFMNDLESFYRLRRKGRITTGEWLHSWVLPDVTPFLARDDLWPALVRVKYGMEVLHLLYNLLSMKVDEDALLSESLMSAGKR
jgi:predicted ATP-grasp superfamily ATP-dependent carboligase